MGEEGGNKRAASLQSLICSQSTFFCVNRDSTGAFMQERAGDRTAGSGRGQYCHISDCHSTYRSPLNAICGDEVIC